MKTNVHCFINDQFPIIATASRADLTTEEAHGDNRYPIVHAVLKRHEVNEQYEYIIDFDQITSLPHGESISYKCPYVDDVRTELIKFISDNFKNSFKFKIDNEFYHCSDFRGTMLNTKYAILPVIDQ